ncbi:MAG: ABC transporter ATP-binding protein [Galactobacter sp.]
MTLTSPRPTVTDSALDVHLNGVGQRFGTHQVLTDVDLTVPAGEIVSILGPSGCGKSTLLRAVAGLDAPTGGTVTIGDQPVSGLDPRCGVGFQEPRLLPWRTVRANVELGLPRGTAKAEGATRVNELLRLVGLTSHAENRPREISGGMAQRASLARALARRPSVLLLDEPFGALDALTRLNMQELLLHVHTAHPSTVLLVTHDVDEALRLSDRIVMLGRDVDTATSPASVAGIHEVPGNRPRKDDDPEILALRHRLLAQLGVHA